MSDFLVRPIGATTKRVLVCLVGLISVGVFFRHQIGSGFDLLSGDRFDGLIEVTILEHWYNVVRGHEAWDTTRFFFPATGTLAYNDGYLGYGLMFVPFRLLGLDPLISGELVNICVKAIGFASFYLLSRISFSSGRALSTLGAVLFTLSCTSHEQGHHVQLFSVAFAPLLMLLVERHIALLPHRPGAAALLGCAAAALLDLWLLTAFYMAWFTVLLIALAVLLGVVLRLARGWRPSAAFLARCWPSALAVVVFAVGALPFLGLYVPKAAETGGHPWSETFSYLPGVLDIVNIGPDNLLFGWADTALNHAVRPEFPVYGEHTVGLPPVLLILFALSLLGVRRRGFLPLLTSVSCVVLWALALHVGTSSLWHAVYSVVPGAKAVRVVCRIQIFLVVPVVLAVTAYLGSLSRRLPAPVLAVLCLVLVLEQLSGGWNVGLDRRAEMARLAAIPPPPAGCKAFYASSTRPGPPLYSEDVDGVYSLNVDAMLLAETIGLPTIDGMDSFAPPGWSLVGTHHPDYMDRVRAYLAANHVEHACELDLKDAVWR
ncbi:MAG: hypothetical protein ACRYG8_15405 [Janthinobacterium lividum]